MFPVFSRMVSERWDGLSVIYVCPLKALLNNLHQRLSYYAGLMGRTCEVWHGDVSTTRKEKIRYTPPDILLTTPESLEGMLVSVKPEGREILASVRIVVVDEIHAFAGDDRGWHLLAVLERVGRLAGKELQRIGLSATVGNPDGLLEWFAGHCQGARVVVAPPAAGAKVAEVAAMPAATRKGLQLSWTWWDGSTLPMAPAQQTLSAAAALLARDHAALSQRAAATAAAEAAAAAERVRVQGLIDDLNALQAQLDPAKAAAS